MMNNRVLVAVCASLAWTALAGSHGWTLNHAEDGGGRYALNELSDSRFILTGTRTDSSCKVARARVSRTDGREMWTQNVVMFSVRSASGRLIRIVPEIIWLQGGKARRARGEKLIYRDSAWHNVTLTLGADFGLPDAGIRLNEIALEIDVENWNPGQTGGIEVKNFRACGAAEVSFSGAPSETFTIVPGAPLKTFKPRADALKVFFAFDNEDVTPTLRTGKKFSRKVPLVWDAQQNGGFREELVKDLGGRVTWTTNLADAAAIVYSRCRPDPALAAELAKAVRELGVPLYAASEIADPEIAALLPCELKDEPSAALPPRERIVAACADETWLSGLSDATFGLYRTCTLRPGVRVWLSFEGGTPALVEGRAEKGRVIYQMTAIGQTLVPGKKSYDAFFARVLTHLTGCALPEEDFNPYAPDADGFHTGVGTDDFGRFGWEYASGLLVEDLGGTLRVVKGQGEYAFRPDDARADFTFAPRDVSALSEGGAIAAGGKPFAQLDASLAYPGTRWEFADGVVRFELSNLATRVAIPTAEGVKILAADESLPAPEAWTAPWMLLFREGRCDPMLVTFGRRLAALEPILEDGALAGYRLVSKAGGVGAVIVTWPWGNASVDASRWTEEGLTPEARERIALWYPRSFTYPIRLKERFRRSADGRHFEITDTFSYRETADEWKTPKRLYAPVSPYAYYMKDRGFASPDPLVKRLDTRTGPFADVDGDTVRWSLPVPEPDLSTLPHTLGYDRFESLANETCRKGIRFSSGGGKLLEQVTKVYPGTKKVPEIANWNMHGALLGICQVMQHPFGLDAANRAAYERRLALRLMEPLETHPYKMTCRFRRDPMSGAEYTIYMNSPRDSFATYSPEAFGSKFLYGDSNETIRMIAMALQGTADRMGQYGAARANRETVLRYVASYALKLDDWLNLSAGCIERGSSYSIDMLNTEYGGMCSFARLAEICGDSHAREQFLFRAARRRLPTLARLTIVDYLRDSGQIDDPAHELAFSCGCNEQGPKGMPRHLKPGRSVRYLELYDMSQGICQDLVSLYDREASDELLSRYFPRARAANVKTGIDWSMLAVFASGDKEMPDQELLRRIAEVAGETNYVAKLCRDWPGMNVPTYLDYCLARLGRTPRLSDCRDVNLHAATFDPATRKLTLDITPGAKAALTVKTVDGRTLAPDLSHPGVRRTLMLETAIGKTAHTAREL